MFHSQSPLIPACAPPRARRAASTRLRHVRRRRWEVERPHKKRTGAHVSVTPQPANQPPRPRHAARAIRGLGRGLLASHAPAALPLPRGPRPHHPCAALPPTRVLPARLAPSTAASRPRAAAPPPPPRLASRRSGSRGPPGWPPSAPCRARRRDRPLAADPAPASAPAGPACRGSRTRSRAWSRAGWTRAAACLCENDTRTPLSLSRGTCHRTK